MALVSATSACVKVGCHFVHRAPRFGIARVKGALVGVQAGVFRQNDTADTLAARVLVQEHRLYPQVLRRFALGQRERIDLS